MWVVDEKERDFQREDRKKRIAEGLGATSYPPFEFMTPCKCLPEIKLKNRGGLAKIPEEFRGLTIKSFDLNRYDSGERQRLAAIAKQAAGKYVMKFEELQKQHPGKGIYFWSRTKGSGKTRLAASIANALIQTHMQKDEYIDVKYTVVLDLIESIKSSFDKENKLNKSEIMNDVENAQVLVLDDIGVESDTPFVNQTIYKLLNHRMTKNLPTIFTSNIPVEELDERYSLDGGRISSRIEKMAFPIALPEQSVRSEMAKEENSDFGNMLLGDF